MDGEKLAMSMARCEMEFGWRRLVTIGVGNVASQREGSLCLETRQDRV